VLESRGLLTAMVPVPASNPRVPLSTIFWNGEAAPLNPNGKRNIPSPESVGAAKTITLTNTSAAMIYPFLRGQNGGIDPNAKPPAPYDPQDRVDHEFRQYVGYSLPGGKSYLGLPSGASITIQVPLVLWDGDNLYLATDGTNLTSPQIFGYDPNASITLATTAPVSGSTWIQPGTSYPAGVSPLVMFYYSDGPPITLPNDAPAQLTEVTFRDQYLANFINDPDQTFPLINYDVSYVNNLVAPVAMQASDVPITYQTDPLPAPPTYFGTQDFGWLATNQTTPVFEGAMANFINNRGTASLGQYFDGKGWPEYYNPVANENNIPSGANLFANSPLNKVPGLVHTSSFDPNRWLLTSAGGAPIQAGGAGVGQQGFVSAGETSRISLRNPSSRFVSDLRAMLQAGPVDVTFPGQTAVLSTVQAYVPNPGGMPYVTLATPIAPSGDSGKVYAFTREGTDYAATAITDLWYSWAQYHVENHDDFAPTTSNATLAFKGPNATNRITLPTAPTNLVQGMTVTAAGVPAGTTILKIEGKDVYLSRIPADATAPTQAYTFGKPKPLPYDPAFTKPYALRFNAAATPNARRFAAAVYEAMACEAAVDPLPKSSLPDSMNIVSQVIQFYANLPDYDRPNATGPALVGQVRDVVKSILRGVYDFEAVPDQTLWYPNPATVPAGLLSGQDFNVFNLDPYVWFVHDVIGMSAYGFSVDDDVANPTATGPLLAADGKANHLPNNLQIQFGGASRLGNPNQWFPTIPWGQLTARATIGVQPTGPYKGRPYVYFQGPNALKIYNQINNPGDGQVGANVLSPGIIGPGATLIFKGPNSGLTPQIIIQGTARPTNVAIPVTITAGIAPLRRVRRPAARA
jgi:hypothetical protein